MADRATLGPPAPAGRLGHFLPYLLGRRLRAVLWPADGGERTGTLLLLALTALYGVGLGFLLNHTNALASAGGSGKLLLSLNATLLASALFVDFLPAVRPVTRVVPEHFPVSARWNVAAAFLLDFITLRRLLILVLLLAALAVAPRQAGTTGFSLLLVLGATAFSFNLRLLLALRRWRHPLLPAHLASLGLMLWWLTHPAAAYAPALGLGMALLPWALGAAQLAWLGPYFSSPFLPDAVAPAVAGAPAGALLSRLPPEHRAYLRRTWGLLLLGLALKILLLGLARWQLAEGLGIDKQFTFYLGLAGISGFTYINNNLFGFMQGLAANELLRLGLTPRVLQYLRLVVPVVVLDGLLSVLLVLALFPSTVWPYLGLVPLYALALTSVGLWSSLYQAKAVSKAINFSNVNKNNSVLMGLVTVVAAAALYFLPWWWARVALALAITASAWWPVRAVLRNDGALRRRLWRGIGA
ncbi:hypothetical protein [Hymenobacter sp. PAMC 26628]|uniref:hypothetical protein n=1 Tax=Hymenobacter sp. PAMC 26628 TaxID=1484118 RepID=UPI00077040AC|nr:hypothetical protein [Hymenobacter sp. PAMC 26628]AMJ64461.1 hypothetical protein AXW84_02730 [Hymenobacter sp. PAMC 26628]